MALTTFQLGLSTPSLSLAAMESGVLSKVRQAFTVQITNSELCNVLMLNGIWLIRASDR